MARRRRPLFPPVRFDTPVILFSQPPPPKRLNFNEVFFTIYYTRLLLRTENPLVSSRRPGHYASLKIPVKTTHATICSRNHMFRNSNVKATKKKTKKNREKNLTKIHGRNPIEKTQTLGTIQQNTKINVVI